MFHSTGRLIYDPTLALKVNTTKEPYWLILDCDDEIARYYRWLVRRHFLMNWLPFAPKWSWTTDKWPLDTPAWGAHISIVRGEKPGYPEYWGDDAGKKLYFEYSGELRNNGKHFWLDVVSPEISDIRDRLGLGRKPRFSNFHLTIGNLDVPLLTPEQEQARLAKIREEHDAAAPKAIPNDPDSNSLP